MLLEFEKGVDEVVKQELFWLGLLLAGMGQGFVHGLGFCVKGKIKCLIAMIGLVKIYAYG